MPVREQDSQELSDLQSAQALRVLVDQARIRVEMPRLMARVLERDPALVHQAIREWAACARPLAEIAHDLREAAEGA